MVPRDTSLHAATLQAGVIRGFTPAQRLQMAIEMSEFTRRLAEAGIRSQYPDYTREQVEYELLRRMYGFTR